MNIFLWALGIWTTSLIGVALEITVCGGNAESKHTDDQPPAESREVTGHHS